MPTSNVSLGRMLVFSTVLPGIVGYVALDALFPQSSVSGLSTLQLTLLAFAIGVLANAIGHFSEILVSVVVGTWPKTPYSELIGILHKVDAQLAIKLSHDFDYLECLHVWYWNTGTAMLLLGVTRLGFDVVQQTYRETALQSFITAVCVVVSPIFFYLAYATRKTALGWVVHLRDELVKQEREGGPDAAEDKSASSIDGDEALRASQA